jgi:hypothetical protein
VSEVREIVREAFLGDRRRSWFTAGGFGVFGAVFTGIALSQPHWNGDIDAIFGMGLLCLVFTAYFFWRSRQLPKIEARVADLVSTHQHELAWIYDVVVPVGHSRVWNVMLWTTTGEKHRLAVYRAHTHQQLWSALRASVPQAIAPYSKERERAMKRSRA